jgi:hypothetical protein
MANLRFTPGLLSSIRDFGSNLAGSQAGARSALTGAGAQPASLGGMLARNVGTMLGNDMRSPQEKIQQELAAIDPNDPQKMAKMYGVMVKYGTPEEQIAASEKLKELNAAKQKTQQNLDYRYSLVNRAAELGLDMAQEIQNAPEAQLKEIAKQLTTRTIKVASRGDDDLATINYAKVNNISKQDLQAAYGQNLQNLPQLEEMQKIVESGQQGDVEVFQDTEGNIKTYSTLGNRIQVPETQEDGSVEYKWVSATEAGLSKAPQLVKQLSTDKVLGEKLAEAESDKFVEGFDAADRSVSTIARAKQALQILPYANTGFFAQGITNIQKVAEFLGAPKSVTASAAASEVYFSNRGQEFAIFVKNFGSGNGITEKDVQIAKEIIGGDIALDRRALRKIIEDTIIVAQNLMDKHNTKVEKYKKRNLDMEGWELGEEPVLSFDPTEFTRESATPSAADSYLGEADRLFGQQPPP